MFVCVEFTTFSHVGTFYSTEPVPSNEDEVSCQITQPHAPGKIRKRDLAVKNPALYQLS